MNDEDLDGLEEDENIEDTYLTFSLGEEVYAVGIAHVTEIVGFQEVIKVPDVPEFVQGVINLRGAIIPVIDVRLRFGMQRIDYTRRTVIIVLEVKGVRSGLVVDSVNDVVDIPPAQVERASQWHGRGGRSVVRGMGRTDRGLCILLDVDTMLQDGEIQVPQAVAEAAVTGRPGEDREVTP